MKRRSLLLLVILICTGIAQAQPSEKKTASEVDRVKLFSLDGQWELAGFSPDKFNHYKLEGTVPGQVHPDLQRAGIIPDPFWRNNAELCQWPEKWQWTYKKVFDVPASFKQDWTVMQFDGLDTYSDIFLNGTKLGSTNNMFLPYEYDVKNILKEKGNVLEVVFYSPTEIEKPKNEQKKYPAAYESARVYTRRMQCTYGWDWVHRFVTMGIWKSCRLVSYPNARIDDLFVYTESIEAKKAKLKLEFSSTIIDKAPRKAILKITDPGKKVLWEKTFSINSPVMKFDAEISNPQLWWPNGAGEQPLYHVTAVLYDARNNELQRKTIETGIRTTSIEQIPDATGVGSSFTIIINGKRIFGKGGNWVPADPFPSRVTAEHYTKILRQAQEAGMNVLRIWGGGIYEPEAFWHACNKMGIMITQDFMLACAEYPTTDPGFVASLKKEFTENIRLVRNNPSLIYWAGDNELGLNFKPSDNWYCKEMHQTMTAPLVQSMDPSRDFRLTSPLGQDPSTTNSLISGDCHLGAQFNYNVINGGLDSLKRYKYFIKKITGRYMSESVAGGIPPKRTLLKFMNEDDLENNYMIDFHMHDPATRGLHGVSFIELFEMQARALFGDPGGDNDRRLSQLEYIQYEFIRLTMESARQRKFYSSGVQFWMFNDCWPAATWSMIDYWGGRKAGWYGMAAGCRPVIAASDVEDGKIRWSVCNDMLEDVKVKMIVRVQPVNGKATFKKEVSLNVKENSSVVAMELNLDEMTNKLGDDAVLVCDISYGNDGYDRATWVPNMPQDVKYVKTNLEVSENRSDDGGEVSIRTNNWARVVTLDADVDFEDNYFEMLPGETRTIKWKAREKDFSGRINVTCWNLQK
jgi:beta-mannosidase